MAVIVSCVLKFSEEESRRKKKKKKKQKKKAKVVDRELFCGCYDGHMTDDEEYRLETLMF